MNNVLLRSISGIGLIILMAGALIWNEYSMLVIVLTILVLGSLEIKKMFCLDKPELFYFILLVFVSFIVFTYLWQSGILSSDTRPFFLVGVLTSIVLYYLFFKNTSVKRLGSTFFNIGWIAISMAFFVSLGWTSSTSANYDPLHPVLILTLVWIYDICAYVFGSLFGKRPLAPAISPKKTWEGFIGGIFLSIGGSFLIYRITGEYDIYFWISAAVITGLGATAGDLFESKLKREAGVKDSGNLIPGHGGILDRFDSLFFSAPLYFVLLSIWERL